MGKRFNVGDKVKIVRKVDRKDGASYFWTDSMDALIGKVGEVVESRLSLDNCTYRVLVEDTTYLWDEKALEAVDKKESKMGEQSRIGKNLTDQSAVKAGDKLMCLQRNTDGSLVKGEIYTVERPGAYDAVVLSGIANPSNYDGWYKHRFVWASEDKDIRGRLCGENA